MRLFTSIIEAHSEIRRDLNSFGTLVKTNTMQNKNIQGNPEFWTKELQNYGYVLDNISLADFKQLPNFTEEYCLVEFKDRLKGIEGKPQNPGNSWKLRESLWKPILGKKRKFDYTYGERLNNLYQVVAILSTDKHNRRCWWPIFTEKDVKSLWEEKSKRSKQVRVPCSLGYHFQIRGGETDKLLMTYIMRSCDFINHWANDVWLARALQLEIAHRLKIGAGTFTHIMFSLHVYQKDVAGEF